MEEWAPSQRHSVADYSRSSDHTQDIDAVTTTFHFRQRLQSLPLGSVHGMPDDMSRLQLQPTNTTQGEGKRKGFRRFLEKASSPFKGKPRRHSVAVEERPVTAWNKLKSATSFQRQSRFPPAIFDDSPVDQYTTLTSPTPGSGKEPPVIPAGIGGARARATAAAQNEGRRSRQFDLLLTEDGGGDRESGIEIAAISTFAEPESYADDDAKRIPRVDFVTALPTELAIQVLAHLDHRSLSSTALVSGAWNKISHSPHVWREAFIREKSRTYAMSKPIKLGAGLGLPSFKPEMNWKELYRVKQ